MEILIENLINQFSLKNLRKIFEEKLKIELREFEDILPDVDYKGYFGILFYINGQDDLPK